MPPVQVHVFREADGNSPLLTWLDELESNEPKAYQKCLARILLLAQLGNELRRPVADLLREGIRELRTRVGRVNYRILYFFQGSNIVCLSHGFTKEGVIPDREIETAIARKKLVERDPVKHTADFVE